jgi:hypothetical protein
MGDEKKKTTLDVWDFQAFRWSMYGQDWGCSHHEDELGFPLQVLPSSQSSSHFHSKICISYMKRSYFDLKIVMKLSTKEISL